VREVFLSVLGYIYIITFGEINEMHIFLSYLHPHHGCANTSGGSIILAAGNRRTTGHAWEMGTHIHIECEAIKIARYEGHCNATVDLDITYTQCMCTLKWTHNCDSMALECQSLDSQLIRDKECMIWGL